MGSIPECQRHLEKMHLEVQFEGRERSGILHMLGEAVAVTGDSQGRMTYLSPDGSAALCMIEGS